MPQNVKLIILYSVFCSVEKYDTPTFVVFNVSTVNTLPSSLYHEID